MVEEFDKNFTKEEVRIIGIIGVLMLASMAIFFNFLINKYEVEYKTKYISLIEKNCEKSVIELIKDK